MLRTLIIGAIILVCLMAPSARSETCPQGVPSCKVLILTPQEEQILVQQGGILSTAAQARFIDLFAATEFLRNKISSAPAGTVEKPADKPTPEPK